MPASKRYDNKKPWIKLWWQGILYGSINADWDSHTEAGLARQMVWVRLLSLLRQSAGGEEGRFEYSPGKPWSLDTIAEGIRVNPALVKEVIETSRKDINPNAPGGRISILEDGTVVITNFPEKQKDTGRAKGLQIQLAKEKAKAGNMEAVMSSQARVANALDRIDQHISNNGNGKWSGWDFFNMEDGSALEPESLPVNLLAKINTHHQVVVDKLKELKVMARKRGD